MAEEDSTDPEEMAFIQRLRDAVERAGKAPAVAERSGVPEKTVYNWVGGRNASKALAFAKIAAACGVSVLALLGRADDATSGEASPELADAVRVPILDITAAAGNGFHNGDPQVTGFFPFPRSVLRRLGIKPEKVRGLRSRGDSMWPTISDGQLVLIDIGGIDLHDGRIYAISAPDGLRLKRIQRQMDGGVLLISDNKDLYEPERIPPHEADAIRVVGHAFWTEKLI